MSSILDYADPHQTKRSFDPLYVAIACGVIPLVTGTAVFVAWLITRENMLALAGLLTILVGLLLFLIGSAFLITAFRSAMAAPPPKRTAHVWLTAALLVSNFPVALCYIVAFNYVENRFTVNVANNGTYPAEVVILHGSRTIPVGTIPPGATRSQSVYVAGGGGVTLHVTQRGVSLSPPPAIYVDSDAARASLHAVIKDGAVDFK